MKMPIEIVNDKKVAYTQFGKVKKEFDVIEEPIPHCFIETQTRLRGWYQDSRKAVEVEKPRTCSSEYFLCAPYRGCLGKEGQKTCTFCYLDNMRGYFQLGVVSLDKTYPEQLKKDLDSLEIGFPAYFSPFCECFNDLEEIYHMTQQSAQVFVDYGLPVMFTTKREVPDWAIEQLKQSPYSSLQVSINTCDNEVWQKLAPIADDVTTLVSNLVKAKEAGVYTLLRVDPILPYITREQDIIDLVDLMLEFKCVDHILFSFAEFGYAAKGKIFKLYQELFPEEYPDFESAFTERFGGNNIVDTKVRLEFFGKMKEKLKDTGVTMSTCSELIVGENGQLRGIPEYQTSVSCHGVATKVHYKGKDGKFHPFKECYGACLHCTTNACGVERLNQARANGMPDYKKMQILVGPNKEDN
jgi:DNA repair photolyase